MRKCVSTESWGVCLKSLDENVLTEHIQQGKKREYAAPRLTELESSVFSAADIDDGGGSQDPLTEGNEGSGYYD